MATSSTHVIQYVGDLRDIQTKLREIDRINKVIARKFGRDFTKATDIVSRSLDKISTRPITLKGGKKATEELRNFTTVIRTTDGSLKTLTQTQQRVNGALKGTNVTIRNGATVARTFGANLKTLLTRAALTIPVWFALRNSIGSVFRTIRDGLKDIVEFDRALQKLRRNVSATSTNLEQDFRNITQEIEAFSIESGVSVQQITNAIQRFATVGFDVETSLKGGIDATKLAVNLFGDAEQTANAFARSLRVLTADIESSEEQQRAISEALALTDQLWQTNAFEVSEFSNNLEKFAGTAKIANLSIEDTLTLLATLSTAGLSNRGGRLLRSTLLRALADFENINRALSLGLDPNETPTIEFVLSLVQALKELRKTENVPAELAETLGDLFSVRSTEALAGLTALEGILKENIALEPDVAKFNNTFEEQNKQINRLVERFKNLNVILSRGFVTGLVGAENFQGILSGIITEQEKLNNEVEKFGTILRNAILVTGVASLVAFRVQLLKVLALLASPVALGALAGFTVLNFQAEAERLAKEAEGANKEFSQLGSDFSKNIIKGFRGTLNQVDLAKLIADLEVFGAEQAGLGAGLNLDLVIQQLKAQQDIQKVKEDQLKIDKETGIFESKRKEIAEAVLQNQLDLLRARGVTGSLLIEAEQTLRKQFNIQGDILDQVTRQIQKEKELTEEQRLRSELGNETIKLFRIAESEGIEVAKRIGDVLSKEISFNDFVRQGGRALEVFEEQFGDLAEQQRALAFFRGERVAGRPGLRGGTRITTGDQAVITPEISEREADKVLQRAIDLFKDLSIEKQTVDKMNVGQIGFPGGALKGIPLSNISGAPGGEGLAGRVSPSTNQFIRNALPGFNANQRLQVAITVDLQGREKVVVGTPEEVARILGDAVSDQTRKIIIDKIANDPNSPEAKAVDRRIDEF